MLTFDAACTAVVSNDVQLAFTPGAPRRDDIGTKALIKARGRLPARLPGRGVVPVRLHPLLAKVLGPLRLLRQLANRRLVCGRAGRGARLQLHVMSARNQSLLRTYTMYTLVFGDPSLRTLTTSGKSILVIVADSDFE